MRTLLLSLCLASACLGAAERDDAATTPVKGTSDGSAATTTEPDNSGVNRRDRDDATLTPENQNFSEADRKLLTAARRSITKDDSLSVSAHNVKIVVEDGHATLRGPVKNEQEKTRVRELVEAVDGITGVTDHLEIKNP